MRRKHFDGDEAGEPRVLGTVHLPHAAGAQGADDLIGAEAAPGCKGHDLSLLIQGCAAGFRGPPGAPGAWLERREYAGRPRPVSMQETDSGEEKR